MCIRDRNIIACSPPKEGVGAHPTIIYTADLCGADVILNLGGVPAVAAMTNGLFVGKFIKTLSFQRMSKEATKTVGAACARISRYEGMEAHARTGDARLRKYGFSN